MGQTYYIYNTRMNAWLGRGVYVSDVNDAIEFSHEGALSTCARHMEDKKIISFPVATSDITHLQDAK